MLLGVDPFAELNVVDYGDAETVLGRHRPEPRRDQAAGGRDLRGRGDPDDPRRRPLGRDPDMTAVAEHYGTAPSA